MIAAFVSKVNRCGYCSGVHVAAAEKLGIPAGLIAKLVDDPTLADAEERIKPVLNYARKLTEHPTSLTQADVEAIHAAGWDSTALFFVVSVTALFNFMNRLVEGMRISLDPTLAEAASTRLAGQGYLPLLALLKP